MGIFRLGISIFRRDRKSCVLAILFLLVGAACELLGLASLVPVVTALFQSGPMHLGVASTILSYLGVVQMDILHFLVLVVFMIVIRGAALYCAYVRIAKISTEIEEELTGRAIDAVMHARWSFILDLGTGRIIDAVTRQASNAHQLVALLAPLTVGAILATSFLSTVAYLSPFCLLFSIVLGLPLGLALKKVRSLTLNAGSDLLPLHEAKSIESIEMIENAKYIKVSCAEDLLVDKFRKLLSIIREKNFRLQQCNAIMTTAPDTLVVIGVSSLIATIYSFSLDSGTNFLLALMLMYRAFHYINQTQSAYQQMHQYLPSMTSLNQLVSGAEIAREIPRSSTQLLQLYSKETTQINPNNAEQVGLSNKSLSFEREIRLEKICFGYKFEKPILNNFSLIIRKNEFVPIRGKSGVGKTTLVDLIVGLHHPQSGRIFVDDTVLTPDLLPAWRNKIAYIPQEPPVFVGTIRENLRWGNALTDESAMLDALRLACLDNLVSTRTGGLDAQIGERGLKLSGGQRQRLLIARAILRNVEIMILDEPTSAVDPTDEALLFERMLTHIKGRKTLIVVMHRGNAGQISESELQMN